MSMRARHHCVPWKSHFPVGRFLMDAYIQPRQPCCAHYWSHWSSPANGSCSSGALDRLHIAIEHFKTSLFTHMPRSSHTFVSELFIFKGIPNASSGGLGGLKASGRASRSHSPRDPIVLHSISWHSLHTTCHIRLSFAHVTFDWSLLGRSISAPFQEVHIGPVIPSFLFLLPEMRCSR